MLGCENSVLRTRDARPGLVLSEAERVELEHIAACYTRPHPEVQRAKLVLMAAKLMGMRGHFRPEMSRGYGILGPPYARNA
jgi:hypothetical protein